MINEIKYLNNLIAAQSELIKDQSDRLKLGCTMTAHIAARDSVIKDQQATINQLKKNAEQALGFIGQIMNHTEDRHVAHFVDMAEQWLSKGSAPECEPERATLGHTLTEVMARLKACQPTAEQAAANLRRFWMLPKPPEVTELKAALPPPWQTVEQFEKSGYQGRCWIRYKGHPVICAYTGTLYTFRNNSGVYMSECISGVIPLPTPSAEMGQ